MPRARRAAVLVPALWCLAGAALPPGSARAAEGDPLVELRRLSVDGHADRALARIPALTAAHPGDPRLPFEQALLLTSERRVADAIAVYERMVREYPGLPEPLNNLGVLYAANGDLDRARSAFESALNLQEAARTAYANLGNVNMRLAGRAYARALHIDDGPHVLGLAPIQRLSEAAMPIAAGGSAVPTVPPPFASAAPARVAAQETTLASARRDGPPAASSAMSPPRAPPASTASPSVVASRAQVATTPAPAGTASAASGPPPRKPPSPPEAAEPRDIQSAIAAWASAWSQRNVDAYFAAYVPGYKGGETSAAAWQAARRVRILGKSRIAVGVNRVVVAVAKDGSVAASFRQTYVADQLNVSSSKTLEFVRQGGKWLIRRELAGS